MLIGQHATVSLRATSRLLDRETTCAFSQMLSMTCLVLASRFPLSFGSQELHGVTFRQTPPSSGLNLNVETEVWERDSAIHFPAFSLHACRNSLMITLFCVCRQREQCSGEPPPSSLMCQRIQMPSIRFVHTLELLRHLHTRMTTTLRAAGRPVCLSVYTGRFGSLSRRKRSSVPCPACVCCLYKQ